MQLALSDNRKNEMIHVAIDKTLYFVITDYSTCNACHLDCV